MEILLTILGMLPLMVFVGFYAYKRGFVQGGKYAILQVRRALAENIDEDIFGTGSKNFINKV